MSGGDSERARLFTRRAIMIGGVKTALFSVLLGKIYYLQVINAEKYKTLAEENRINFRLLPPKRGSIFDATGTLLAHNQKTYRLILLPEQVESFQDVLEKINAITPLSDSDRKRIIRDKNNQANFNSLLIKDNLTWEEVSALSINTPYLPGCDVDLGEVRSYPFGEELSHVLGYVGLASKTEISREEEEDGDLLGLPGFRIGKNGIEKKYDSKLRGQAGDLQIEVNAHGRVVRDLAKNAPVAGSDLKLNLHLGLQTFVMNRLASEESASVVVMDIHTGAVRALVSHPAYDPNLFAYGISQTDWDKLNNDPHHPLLNKAVSGLYAPGSTIKPAIALAALESGLVDSKTTVFCPGYYELGNFRMHCWKHGGHGTVNMKSAIAGSCDTYFYDIGKRIGIDRIQSTLKRFGFGQKTGLDLPHERSGLVPGRTWKFATYGKLWQQGETLNTAIGQGYMLATTMQLAAMSAIIANGGNSVTPHLANTIGGEPVSQEPPVNLGLNPQHLAIIRDAMSAVVNSNQGTAYGSRITREGWEMAGKTGTAQVRTISQTERAEGVIANNDLAWEQRDHALFTGYAPVDKPRFAISVIIEHGGSGGHTAAPIARDIMTECQRLLSET